MLKGELINLEDVSYLDKILLDGDGCSRFLKPLPAAELQALPHIHLRQWAMEKARYQFVTTELLRWLGDFIGDRAAIEVGSGQGDLGWHLAIHMTDNYCQQRPEMLMYYSMLRHTPTNPPPEVEKIDAVEAVKKYRPKVVVASWVTQKALPSDDGTSIGANFYGPDEFDILTDDAVEAYVHIGNMDSHKDKRIFNVKHRRFSFSWLVSRARDQSQNAIWVWGK